MIEIPKKVFMFNTLEVWFPDKLYNDSNYSRVKNLSYEDWDNKEFIKTKGYGRIIDLTQSEENIWKNMDKTCRNSITHAQKDGMKVERSYGLEGFHKVYSELYKAKKVRQFVKYPLDYLEKCILFVSKLKGEHLSGAVFVKDDKYILLLANASWQNVHGRNNILMWEVMKCAKKEGLEIFDFGGAVPNIKKEDPRYGVEYFKASFGGKIVPFYQYIKFNSKIFKFVWEYYGFLKEFK